eukprot:CAMPEP_0206050166 /NCGR_PEP_ID=MMETSP1466-20131121/28543_1 /ASSEMBLY_ACC=CAM_ASM_001126 /TAXON_ID=44452 /ORGANISM="Pavlova gyrans, Strain CCMP608" /LENGTH=389 /DNA_ID=CAMNT_0053425273 /DNA_START=24 /DNA_END=1194 /DNA_ORIENTATION=+
MALTKAQMEKLDQVFHSFDLDGNDSISVSELEAVTHALGLALTKQEVHDMLSEADADKSGEVDYAEFVKVMEHHLPKVGQDGRLGAFGHLITRKAKSGPPLAWHGEKCGDRVTVSEDRKVVSRDAPEGWGVQLFDAWLSAATSTYNTADVLLEVEQLTDGNVFIGIAGRNFFPSPWDHPLKDSKHCAVVSLADGAVWRKTVKTDLLLGAVSEGDRIHVFLDMLRQSMTIDLLAPDNSLDRSVTVDELPSECTLAVCLGPGAQRVRIVGSSTEVATHEFSGKTNKDLWDEDNVQRLAFEKKESIASIEAVAQSLEEQTEPSGYTSSGARPFTQRAPPCCEAAYLMRRPFAGADGCGWTGLQGARRAAVRTTRRACSSSQAPESRPSGAGH